MKLSYKGGFLLLTTVLCKATELPSDSSDPAPFEVDDAPDPTQRSLLGDIPGQCCFKGNPTCFLKTRYACEHAGGTYKGGSPCLEKTCSSGACCFPDESRCVVVQPSVCRNLGGYFKGFGSVCNVATCPEAFGACCYSDGECKIRKKKKCGGNWQGPKTKCLPETCAPPPPVKLPVCEPVNPHTKVGGYTLGELQLLWWNWNLCEDAFGSTDGSCASQDQVPEGWIFLAGAGGNCSAAPLERICDVPEGIYNVFQPVINVACADYSDDDADCDKTREGCTATSESIEPKSSYSELFARQDGRLLHIFYLFDDTPRYFPMACKSGKEYCDECDDPVCTSHKGVDSYPNYGWWALKEHVSIKAGIATTFEVGANNLDFNFCPRVKYTLHGVKNKY